MKFDKTKDKPARKRHSHGGLRPYNKRTGNGTQDRRQRKIGRRSARRKVIPGG